MLKDLNSSCPECIKHVGLKEVFVKLMPARIFLRSSSYCPCCDQPGCNQTWPEADRSGRETAVIFPFRQFTTVASSRQSQVSLGYSCPPKSFSFLLPSQPWSVLPAMSLLILPDQMTCTCCWSSWSRSWSHPSNMKSLVSWPTPLPQATLSTYCLTYLLDLISPPTAYCLTHLFTLDCQPETHFIFSGLNLSSFGFIHHFSWSQPLGPKVKQTTDQLNHVGLPQSVNIKLVSLMTSDIHLSDNCPSFRDDGISPIL